MSYQLHASYAFIGCTFSIFLKHVTTLFLGFPMREKSFPVCVQPAKKKKKKKKKVIESPFGNIHANIGFNQISNNVCQVK
jgi:hypothetical protein